MEYNRGKTPASGVRGRTTDKTRQDKTVLIIESFGKFSNRTYNTDSTYNRVMRVYNKSKMIQELDMTVLAKMLNLKPIVIVKSQTIH